MKSWMWVGVALLGSANGEAAESRIIGGTDATAGAWPWIVSLENSDLGAAPYASSFCGGSLIASDWDIVDLGMDLESMGFRGDLYALTRPLPRAELVAREVGAVCPGLNVRLLELA